MRGTVNEKAVLKSISIEPFVEVVFEVGMLAMKDARFLACSPDGIAVVKKSYFGGRSGCISSFELEG